MKTLFIVQMHRKGEYMEDVFKMIQNHNAGEVNIDIDVLCGFLQAKKAMYPADKLFIQTEGENGQTIHISDDGGKTIHTTITEIEAQEYPITEHCVITTGTDENNQLLIDNL